MALLAAAVYVVLPVEEVTWIGLNTERIRITYSVFGVIVAERIGPGHLTGYLEQYLGPLPTETEWREAHRHGYGMFGVSSESPYEHALKGARLVDWLLTNERNSMTGCLPLEHGMTEEAKRMCLRQFIIALHEWNDGGYVVEDYATNLFVLLPEFDREVGMEDVMTFAEFKVIGLKTVSVWR